MFLHLTAHPLQDLASGYMSGKLLMKLDSIGFLLQNHTEEHYAFLAKPVNSRNRTTFYATLARLLFMEDSGPGAKFKAFVAPLHAVRCTGTCALLTYTFTSSHVTCIPGQHAAHTTCFPYRLPESLPFHCSSHSLSHAVHMMHRGDPTFKQRRFQAKSVHPRSTCPVALISDIRNLGLFVG